MATRIQLTLDRLERAGLMRLAELHLRSPRDQLRLILREELERAGLLEPAQDLHRSTEPKQKVANKMQDRNDHQTQKGEKS